MKSKLIHEQAGERTFALIFQAGDEVMNGLKEFLEGHRIEDARITAIGALSGATIGYFDWERKDYKKIPVDEQVELLSLVGDVALADGKPAVHAHVVLGRSDGSTRGGHLIEAHVRPTVELILVESPARLRKKKDPESGLMLINI